MRLRKFIRAEVVIRMNKNSFGKSVMINLIVAVIIGIISHECLEFSSFQAFITMWITMIGNTIIDIYYEIKQKE